MDNFAGIQIEDAVDMSEFERLEAAFKQITNKSIQHIEADLEVARAMDDQDKIKVFQVQLGMYRHAQTIFAVAKNYATHKRWQNDKADD